MKDITTIVILVLSVMQVLVLRVLIPWIRAKKTAAQWEEIAEQVKVAVTAAEQIYKGSGRGAVKKTYVRDWLRKRGLDIDFAQLDAFIESAVFEMNLEKEGKHADF